MYLFKVSFIRKFLQEYFERFHHKLPKENNPEDMSKWNPKYIIDEIHNFVQERSVSKISGYIPDLWKSLGWVFRKLIKYFIVKSPVKSRVAVLEEL